MWASFTNVLNSFTTARDAATALSDSSAMPSEYLAIGAKNPTVL